MPLTSQEWDRLLRLSGCVRSSGVCGQAGTPQNDYFVQGPGGNFWEGLCPALVVAEAVRVLARLTVATTAF